MISRAHLNSARLYSARLRGLLSAAFALLTLFVANTAAACPVCAQRNEGGLLRTVSLGALVLAPWCIALAVGLYIRRGLRQSQIGSETSE